MSDLDKEPKKVEDEEEEEEEESEKEETKTEVKPEKVEIKKEDGEYVRFFPFAQGLELGEVVSLQNVEMCEKIGGNGIYYLVQKK